MIRSLKPTTVALFLLVLLIMRLRPSGAVSIATMHLWILIRIFLSVAVDMSLWIVGRVVLLAPNLARLGCAAANIVSSATGRVRHSTKCSICMVSYTSVIHRLLVEVDICIFCCINIDGVIVSESSLCHRTVSLGYSLIRCRLLDSLREISLQLVFLMVPTTCVPTAWMFTTGISLTWRFMARVSVVTIDVTSVRTIRVTRISIVAISRIRVTSIVLMVFSPLSTREPNFICRIHGLRLVFKFAFAIATSSCMLSCLRLELWMVPGIPNKLPMSRPSILVSYIGLF